MSATKPLVELLEIARRSDWKEPSQIRCALLEIATHKDATQYQFQDALNMALGYDSPELALEIHDAYERKFAEELRGDFSRSEIETMLHQKSEIGNPKRVFKRQTILARGHISNYVTLHPVTEIIIAPSSITFAVAHYFILTERHVYDHDKVFGIAIRERKSWKGVGNTAANFVERTCRVITSNRTFLFDVSGSYSDFKNPRELVKELAKFHTIEHVGEKWAH